MNYPCIPDWVKPRKQDPFNYKLRTPDEVSKSMEIYPPCFPIQIVVLRNFEAEAERGDDIRTDNIDQTVRK